MRKLKSLNCEVKEIKICSNYIRNGTTCNYLRFSNGITRTEALNALRRYNDNMAKNADKEFWALVLKNMENEMKVQINQELDRLKPIEEAIFLALCGLNTISAGSRMTGVVRLEMAVAILQREIEKLNNEFESLS